MTNTMHPRTAMIMDEDGTVYSLVELLKGIGGNGMAKQIELQKNETHIQWKYDDEEEWTDLVSLEELRGKQGETGEPGPAGTPGEQGPQGEPGPAGFGTKEQYDAIIKRLDALEKPELEPEA